jgi:hypothetical protein
MRRALLISTLFVTASCGAIKTAAAVSPDCDRWLRQYQQAIQESRPVRHVRKQLAHLVKPKPRVAAIPAVRTSGPKLTPQEMLRRFRILCGEDLPQENETELLPPVQIAPPLQLASFLPTDAPAPLLAPPSAAVPVPPQTTTTPQLPGQPVISPGIPVIPTPVGGPVPNIPIPPPPGGGTPITPITPVPPPAVPEPSSIALMLTGVLAVVTATKRRFAR